MEANFNSSEQTLYSQIENSYGKVVYSFTTHMVQAENLYRHYCILKKANIFLSAMASIGILGAYSPFKVPDFIYKSFTNILSRYGISTDFISLCSFVFMLIICSASIFLVALNIYFSDHDFSSTYQKHVYTANKLWFLREQYVSLLTDFSTLTREQILQKRDELQDKVSEVYKEAPLTSPKSYQKAQKALKENQYQFFSRDELNLLLPESLRKR